MSTRTVNHSTFVIERTYPAAPERVFAALADPARKRRWFAEGEDFGVDAFEMDFRVGGFERTRFKARIPTAAAEEIPCANDSLYLDIVPNQRIVLAYTMTIGGKRISASQATFELLPVGSGTQLIFTEQAAFFEGGDGPQIREAGWRQLFDRMGREVAQ
jgi:uncharacterized protein YndB with AHSA1/START domain